MKHALSCELNLDTAYAALSFSDGRMVSIVANGVENEAVSDTYQRSELDYLFYNDLAA